LCDNFAELTQGASSLIMMSRDKKMPARKVTPSSGKRLTVTLDAADRSELERLSKESDRSLAWIVREAVRQYLAKLHEER
jgi:hypothetical protein